MTRYQGNHGQGTMLEQLARVTESHRRPVGVTVAGWLTIVLSALWAGYGVLCVVRTQAVVDWILSRPRAIEAMPRTDPEVESMLVTVTPWVGAFTVVVGVIGIVLGGRVLRRRRLARTWLTVTSVLMIISSLSAVAYPPLLPWLIGPIVTIVGIRSSAAKTWFDGAYHRYR